MEPGRDSDRFYQVGPMASSGDDTVQSLLSAQSEVSTVGEDSKTKGQLRTRGEGPHNDPLNCRASVSAAGSGEGGLAPGLHLLGKEKCRGQRKGTCRSVFAQLPRGETESMHRRRMK